MAVFNKKTTTPSCKKTKIKKLNKDSNKLVTISKHRDHIVKKASELSVLCNTQFAVIGISPAGKRFCFGQPNAEAVLRRYLGGTSESDASPAADDNSFSYGELKKLYEENLELERKLELQKKRLEKIENYRAKVSDGGKWWDLPIDDMDSEILELHIKALCELKRMVLEKAEELRSNP